MCALMNERSALVYVLLLCIASFLNCTKHVKLNSESASSIFPFLIANYRRNLHTSGRRLVLWSENTISRMGTCILDRVKGNMLSEVKRKDTALPGDERESQEECEEWREMWSRYISVFLVVTIQHYSIIRSNNSLLRPEQVGLNCLNQREHGLFHKLDSAHFKIIFNKTVKCFCGRNLLALSKQQNNKAAWQVGFRAKQMHLSIFPYDFIMNFHWFLQSCDLQSVVCFPCLLSLSTLPASLMPPCLHVSQQCQLGATSVYIG